MAAALEPDMRRLVMHIGMPKTGSTALVDFLRKNTKDLDAAGFVFPQQARVRFLREEGQGAEALTGEWEPVRQALDKGGKTVLVSDEDLYHQLLRHPERVQAVRAHLGDPDIRVVLYVRRQDILLESLYREMIRGVAGPVLDLDYAQICRRMGDDFLDYDAAVRFFQEQFGETAVTVRVFERRALEQGCLFHDFCAAAEIPWSEAFWRPEGQINKAADARLADVFSEVNATYEPFSGEARQLKEVLEELGRAYYRKQENRRFSSEERQTFLRKFAGGNAALAGRLRIGADPGLFAQGDLGAAEEPRRLTARDLIHLLLGLNHAWARGLGAVPFRAYNLQKLRYLRLRLASVSGGRRLLLRAQILLHGLLRCFLNLLPSKWTDAQVEEQTMRALAKDLRLLRQAGEDWLPWSGD